ncbi:MAG TPA: hypothetical protein VGQ00_03415 [Candidatus Norongarragalinales archaeon]|nr:hypothetical protein [Candidatus Norongarragalinales archaeon]
MKSEQHPAEKLFRKLDDLGVTRRFPHGTKENITTLLLVAPWHTAVQAKEEIKKHFSETKHPFTIRDYEVGGIRASKGIEIRTGKELASHLKLLASKLAPYH